MSGSVSLVNGHMDPPTNYERIKNMSLEEMANKLTFIFSEDAEIPEDVAEMYYRTGLTMDECWKRWLESEVAAE